MISLIQEQIENAKGTLPLTEGDGSNNEIKASVGDSVAVGKAGDDVINGTSGNNVLIGNTGHDIISAGAGDDLISGGVGKDVLKGAAGNDLIIATTDDALIAGGGGFDRVFVQAEGDDDNIDLAKEGRGVEAVVAYGDTPVTADVSLAQILGQSQDDGDAATPDMDNSFIALGLESLDLQGIRKFKDADGDLVVSQTDLDEATEAAYFELLGIDSLLREDNTPDLHAYTFGTGEDAVTIITDLAADEIFAGGESLDASLMV